VSGKGSRRRPTNEAAYMDNYERIFGRNPVRRVESTRIAMDETVMACWSDLLGLTAGVNQCRQVTDLAVTLDGSINVPVLDTQPLTGADLGQQVTGV
jgi:hypothetical protein